MARCLLEQISKYVARNLHCRVAWFTPMGLPVVQPYVKPGRQKRFAADSLMGLDLPDGNRQANAFPPNFIHSLDSCHMMLTALHCFRRGITFASVHDCFWTHPSMVDHLNQICREEFIALHSQPVLEDLSEYIQERFGYTTSELEAISDPEKRAKAISFNNLLRKVPEKGQFNLQEVRDSAYFFS
ncbi:hypothetical protein Ciccas_004958 [Cichlidogyrus casuarinus]|uniref:DNA-directed RNA polymerase n=1 Tax=Cichlidogyrus casuarinus TaxID=1844966 RepID=A0ABD2QA18_9PLAT